MYVACKHCGDLCSKTRIHYTFKINCQQMAVPLQKLAAPPPTRASIWGWNPTGCPQHGHGQGATGIVKAPEAGDSQTDRSTKKKLQICLTIPADAASKCCRLAQKQLQADLRLTLSLFPVREEKRTLKWAKYFSCSILMSSFKAYTEATQCNGV